jgi:hypothetical protein
MSRSFATASWSNLKSGMELLPESCISDMHSGNCRNAISPPPYPVPQRGEGVNKELCMCSGYSAMY